MILINENLLEHIKNFKSFESYSAKQIVLENSGFFIHDHLENLVFSISNYDQNFEKSINSHQENIISIDELFLALDLKLKQGVLNNGNKK